LSGGDDGVQVWRVKDGKKMARMKTKTACCLAVSKDGRWIAAGTLNGNVHVWDANTYKQAFACSEDDYTIQGVDFSPDSTRLVSVSSNGTVTVWDIATHKQVRTFHPKGWAVAAKYSPQGDRIATGTKDSVRVYDSNDGRVLVDIKVGVTPWHNPGFLWLNNHLLVVSSGEVKRYEVSTGATVSKWPLPGTGVLSCIALPKHGESIACSGGLTVTLWDTSTHIQSSLLKHSQRIRSIALSPDDRLLAIGGEDGELTIINLSCVTVRIVSRWIMVHMTKFLVPIIFPHRVRSLCLVYNPRSRKQVFRSTMPRSIFGSTINSRTPKHL